MSITLKTIIMMPVMFAGAYLYVSALITVGRRTSKDRPSSIVALAGTLVWLAYVPFLLAPFFCLIFTEISPIEGDEIWLAIKMMAPVIVSYLLMVTPGLFYIFKFRIKELQKYGYFISNT